MDRYINCDRKEIKLRKSTSITQAVTTANPNTQASTTSYKVVDAVTILLKFVLMQFAKQLTFKSHRLRSQYIFNSILDVGGLPGNMTRPWRRQAQSLSPHASTQTSTQGTPSPGLDGTAPGQERCRAGTKRDSCRPLNTPLTPEGMRDRQILFFQEIAGLSVHR